MLKESLMRIPPVRELILEECDEVVLRSLSDNLGSVTNLQLEELKIEGCSQFETFGKMILPSSLRRLVIRNCKALKSLPDGIMEDYYKIEEIIIEDCPSLILFPSGNVPNTLKRLQVRNCQRLQNLPSGIIQDGKRNKRKVSSTHLEYLDIEECRSLIPYSEIRNYPTTIKTLVIRDAVTDISNQTQNAVTHISNLGETETVGCLLLDCFPENVLPFRFLRILRFENCRNLTFLPDQIDDFSFLQKLTIWTCPKLEFLPNEIQNLISLRDLTIRDCPRLRSYSSQMQNLKSLSNLKIRDCPSLEFLPKMQHIFSLQCFTIRSCRRLKVVQEAEGVLPRQLTCLRIEDSVHLIQFLFKWGFSSLGSLTELRTRGSLGSQDLMVPIFDSDIKVVFPRNLRRLNIGYLGNLNH